MNQSSVLKKLHKIFKPKKEVTLETVFGVSEVVLSDLIRNKDKNYYSNTQVINGKKRDFKVSTGQLRTSLNNSRVFLKDNLHWPKYLHGGVKGKDSLSNAKVHQGNEFVLSIDIRDFFPSISKTMVRDQLVNLGFPNEVAEYLSELGTVNDVLVQGFETSTYLANLVFLQTDIRIYNLVKRHKLSYSRAVDDISISSSKPLHPYLGSIQKYLKQAKFYLADEKTLMSDNSGRKVVTKLVVNDKIRPKKEYYRSLKKLIRRCWPENEGLEVVSKELGLTPTKLQMSIWGKLNYIKRCDKKLFQEIRALVVKVK